MIGVIDALGLVLLALRVPVLRFRSLLATAAVKQLHTGDTHAAQDHKKTGQHQRSELPGTHAGLGREAVLESFELATQRFAVADDGGLRFTRRDQTLQVAKNGAGLRARFFIQLDECGELLARLRVTRRTQTQLRTAIEQPLRDFLERIQVLAQQKHRLRAYPLGSLKLVGRFADTLCQHPKLPSR